MKNQRIEIKNSRSGGRRIVTWLVLIGIFVCGVMAGAFIWQKHVNTADSGTQTNLVRYNKKISKCQMREDALLANIQENIDNGLSGADVDHTRNAEVYEQLAKVACNENRDKYLELADTERQIAEDLRRVNRRDNDVTYYYDIYDESEPEEPCAVIEKTLLRRINTICDNSWCHLENAEVYSKMAEDGCPVNKDANTKLALDELQIAEGVRIDDTNVQESDIRATVNTYKKLQMQNEAKKYINKVEKLVNPGIDFILELQRIIEE